jgi:hypothetical protein
MSDDVKAPSNAELLAALHGMWRQQKDLVSGIEGRLASKIDAAVEQLDSGMKAAEDRLGARLAKEIQDRPVVVHIDMSRVSELEKQLGELARRVAELEARVSPH